MRKKALKNYYDRPANSLDPENPHDRVVILCCKAANARQLAQCLLEEADNYQDQAVAEADLLGPNGDLSDSLVWPQMDGSSTEGLPDDWLGIAEIELPEERG